MKSDGIKQVFVYGNISFVIVAGFYVLYQLATTGLGDQLGAASIFAGFVGMAIQFITGSEIATRANRAAESNFATGLATPPPAP